jgi:hypothetical protein
MTGWVYEVVVVGQLGDDVLSRVRAELGDVAATIEPPSTLISGFAPDQAALLGLLDAVQALGLHVRELRRVVEPGDSPNAGPGGHAPDSPPGRL